MDAYQHQQEVLFFVMGQLFGSNSVSTGSWNPAININHKGSCFLLQAAVEEILPVLAQFFFHLSTLVLEGFLQVFEFFPHQAMFFVFFAKKGATAVHALIHHQIPEENCHHPPQETKKLAEDSTAACAAAKQVGWPRWRLATIFFLHFLKSG